MRPRGNCDLGTAPQGMKARESIPLLMWLSAAFGEASAQKPSSSPANPCVVAVADAPVPVRVTEKSRGACAARARLIEPTVPAISDAALRVGPSKLAIKPEDDVYCRLLPREKSGGSLKFRCLRTNAYNQLFDEDGRLVREAVAFDDDGKLLDSAGGKIRDEDGDAIKGDELRVKYFIGAEPAARYREVFTETVVSRLFWALGIPVDRVYLPANVHCFGCSPNPFGQLIPEQSSTPRAFPLSSVERPYEGKKIATDRRSGFLGLGGRYDHGWSFDEITRQREPSRRLEAEVLAMALNLVAYNNLHSYQNDLVCHEGAWNKKTGECSDPVAYVSDVGGTLGGSQAFMLEGEGKPAMRRYPRGDFITFSRGQVFSNKAQCMLHYPVSEIARVSEGARREMDARIRSRLGREQLRIIFEAASVHRMEKRVNDLVGEHYELGPGPTLDLAVQLLWADELASRLDEILAARCPT